MKEYKMNGLELTNLFKSVKSYNGGCTIMGYGKNSYAVFPCIDPIVTWTSDIKYAVRMSYEKAQQVKKILDENFWEDRHIIIKCVNFTECSLKELQTANGDAVKSPK